MSFKFNQHVVTGTADGITAGLTVSGASLHLGTSYKTVKDLSAVVVVDAETDTLTLTPRWEVSNDESTWWIVTHGSNNAAAVAIATGTGSADASVSRVIPAPDAIEGYQFARLSLIVGATDGNTADTYEIGYSYRRVTGAEAF